MGSFKFLAHSLVDSPTGAAAVIFCRGCVHNCPYCHNQELRSFTIQKNDLLVNDVINNINKLKMTNNKGEDFTTVDWLILSGGDPIFTHYSELNKILDAAKNIGLKTGIYTTASNSAMIKRIKPIDYYHIDYKGPIMEQSPDDETLESLKWIKDQNPEYFHINTTLMPEIHTKSVLNNMYSNLFKLFDYKDIPIIKNSQATEKIAWLHTKIRNI